MSDWHKSIRHGMLTEAHPPTPDPGAKAMSFDEEPEEPHGECEQEIRFLQARLDRVQQFLKDQWSLIPISTLARPGSYARGVQTGMSDVLAGLQRVLVWASDRVAPAQCDWHAMVERKIKEYAQKVEQQCPKCGAPLPSIALQQRYGSMRHECQPAPQEPKP